MSTHTVPDSRNSIAGRWRYLPGLIRLLWRMGPVEVSIIAAVAAVSGLVPVLALAVLQRLVDAFVAVITQQADTRPALIWVGAFLGITLMERIVEELNDWLRGDVVVRLLTRVEGELLAVAGGLSLAAFENPDSFDRLHRAQRGLNERLYGSMDSLFLLPTALVAAIGALAYLATAHPVLPLILIIGMVPANIYTGRIFKKVWLLSSEQTGSERRAEYLTGLMTQREPAAEVRLFRLGSHLIEARRALVSRLRRERLDLAGEHMRRVTLHALADQVSFGAVIAGVLMMILRGGLSIGHFASHWEAAQRFKRYMMSLMNGIMNTDTNLRYVADLIDYLEASESEASPTDVAGSPRDDGGREIVFQGVSFAYPGSDQLVLESVDLTIAPGEPITLVGRNGAGKSTLAKLLLGLYAPTAGRILIDGVDLAAIDPSEWRKEASAVFQDYMRFDISARDNIVFGDLTRTHDQPAVERAAVKSGAAEVIAALPEGFDTILGRAFDEAGQDISSGQWQRLASARAYFRDASVLVLDEPTAALDAKAEVDVYRRFRELSQGRTVLFISHRLGSARLADRILFLEDGRIVEDGTHHELLARGGRYSHIYSIQAEWYK